MISNVLCWVLAHMLAASSFGFISPPPSCVGLRAWDYSIPDTSLPRKAKIVHPIHLYFIPHCIRDTVLHEAEAFVSPTRSFGKLDSRSHLASNGHAVCSAGSAFSPVPRGASMRSMQRAGIVKRCRGGVQRHVLKAQMTDEEMALDQASAVFLVLDVE